ncbi:cysteine hydrolase [Pandoraea capi]|uniref:cysteine hydrolase family protein n=1 Tax=Pandoraea TaxID=93217 RepID=UPI001F5C55A5|nr:cysteine hydrolase [Pandoraea capi]
MQFDARKTALVVIDMQNDFCTPGGWLHSVGAPVEPMRKPIAPINRVSAAMRDAAMPVIWLNWGNRPDLLNVPAAVRLPFDLMGEGIGLSCAQKMNPFAQEALGSRVLEKGSWGARIVDELEQAADDIHIDKFRISGFPDTGLDSILRRLGIDTLIFAGVNVDQCVLATLMDATFLGYDAMLLEDCVATSSPDFCTEAALYNVRTVFGFVSCSERLVRALSSAPGIDDTVLATVDAT